MVQTFIQNCSLVFWNLLRSCRTINHEPWHGPFSRKIPIGWKFTKLCSFEEKVILFWWNGLWIRNEAIASKLFFVSKFTEKKIQSLVRINFPALFKNFAYYRVVGGLFFAKNEAKLFLVIYSSLIPLYDSITCINN